MSIGRAASVKATSSICWLCQLRSLRRLYNVSALAKRSSSTLPTSPPSRLAILIPPDKVLRYSRRQQHANATTVTAVVATSDRVSDSRFLDIPEPTTNIRGILRKWHADNSYLDIEPPMSGMEFPISKVGVDDSDSRGNKLDDQGATGEEQPQLNLNLLLDEFDRISAPYEGIDTVEPQFSRGDIIELKRGGSAEFAVYLTSHGQYSIYYTQSGGLHFSSVKQGLFSVKGFFTVEDVQPIINCIPERAWRPRDYADLASLSLSVPVEVGAKVTRRLANFQLSSEACFRNFSNILDHLHYHAAHATDYKIATVDDLADTVLALAGEKHLKEVDRLALKHAVVVSCTRQNLGFTASQFDLFRFAEFGVESRYTVKSFQNALQNIRAYQYMEAKSAGGTLQDGKQRSIITRAQHVKDFIAKCRLLVAESRALRVSNEHRQVLSTKPTVGDIAKPDAYGVIHSLQFNDRDREFITFLKHNAHRSFYHHTAYESAAAVLLRAVRVYDDVNDTLGLSSEAMRTFLIEIGVWQPYTMVKAWDREVHSADSALTKSLEHMQTTIDAGAPPYLAAGLHDSMKELRKDWGNQLVLAIDDSKTKVVDDGLSVEMLPEEPGVCWLHVHVSHLSAWVPPDSVLARMAASRAETQYYSERVIPMLPDWLSAEYGIRPGGTVMTSSMKVDMTSGEILDFKMQPGIVHKVVRVDFKSVDKYLGFKDDAKQLEVTSFSVGEMPRHPRLEDAAIVSSDIKGAVNVLESLTKSMAKHIRPSVSEGAEALMQNRFGHTTKVYGIADSSDAYDKLDERHTHAKFSTLNPSILRQTYQSVFGSIYEGGADNIVRVSMLAANLQAAKWARARHLPLPYYGTGIANDGAIDSRQRYRNELEHMMKSPNSNYQLATEQLWHYFTQVYGVKTVSSHPIPHRSFADEPYTKITSPLRRYYDLVANWQLDAEVRKEFEHGQTASAKDCQEYLPFTQEQMNRLMLAADSRLAKLRKLRLGNAKHWSFQMLARMFYLEEGQLPKRLVAQVGEDTGTRRYALIQELSILGEVRDKDVGEDGNPIETNDLWEVAIDYIALKSRQMTLRCIRKVSKDDSDVDACPVCKDQFSWYFRKHHCRKCGKVVCANCSQHRITMPQQYIVQAPPHEQTAATLLDGRSSNAVSGETVRVCNPCVPDPNCSLPPQDHDLLLRRNSYDGNVRGRLPRGDTSQLVSAAQVASRYRSSPSQSLRLNSGHGNQHYHSRTHRSAFSSSVIPSTATIPHTPADFLQASYSQRRSTVSSGLGPPQHHMIDPSARVLSHTNALYGELPTSESPEQPYLSRVQLAEEDECPVCGHELPTHTASDDDAARARHIDECIRSYGSLPARSNLPAAPRSTPDVPSFTRLTTDPNAQGTLDAVIASARSLTPSLTSSSAQIALTYAVPATSLQRRAPRMLDYKASEKDCVDDRGEQQECVICFEEFEVGDNMGRLECLCKFHRKCIVGWWRAKDVTNANSRTSGGQGSAGCPTHVLQI
ncbi:hypothetical protein FH972_022559 [Carpinus fangiana]|uniref:FYVE-type domain-containing protein n=1 Tax=Carpinus fangiana TaxID=176857 RepID=A0A5N6KSK5_9ROSI|nr:hypothetical protein FH972_022559 [Carpinus fangiana]